MKEIFNKYGTDKSARHNYELVYEPLFSKIKDKKLNILELGIGSTNEKYPYNMTKEGTPGASLRAWKEIFPNSNIYGADIDKDILFEEERIKTYQVDVTKKESIISLKRKLPQLDIIIDDGLHEFFANKAFLLEMMNSLSSNGIYIIEDVKNSQIKDFNTLFRESIFNDFEYVTIYNLDHSYNNFDNNIIVLKRKKIKIGIGVTGFNRPENALMCIKSIFDNLSPEKYDYDIKFFLDKKSIESHSSILEFCPIFTNNGLGISINRSNALFNLKDNDYIFIFEDDVLIKKKGFEDLYINAMNQSGINMFNSQMKHFMSLNKVTKFDDFSISVEPGHGAVCFCITKNELKKLGALNPKFRGYGFEHVEYTNRWLKMVDYKGGYPIIVEMWDYFEDQIVDSSLSKEEKDIHIKANAKIFGQPIERVFISLEEVQKLIYES